MSGPDAHFHKTITESFYILSGTVRLYDGTKWMDTTAGDFLFVPQGGIHAFKNESGQPASMLPLFTPGAPREDYFETLVEVARGNRTLTDEEWVEFYRRHDTYWLALTSTAPCPAASSRAAFRCLPLVPAPGARRRPPWLPITRTTVVAVASTAVLAWRWRLVGC